MRRKTTQAPPAFNNTHQHQDPDGARTAPRTVPDRAPSDDHRLADLSSQDAATGTEPTQERFPTFIGAEHRIRSASRPAQRASHENAQQSLSTRVSPTGTTGRISGSSHTVLPIAHDPAPSADHL